MRSDLADEVIEVVDGRKGGKRGDQEVRRAPGVQEPADDDQRYLRKLDLSLSRQRKMLESGIAYSTFYRGR
jgi:hypothetical protein